MENASKALLIAAGILLAILLITIGISVYRTATESMGDVGAKMSAAQIQEFNQHFESYVTKAATYQRAKSAVETVLSISGDDKNEFGATVDMYLDSTQITDTTVDSICGSGKSIAPGVTYSISVEKSTSGLINKIIFKAN